MVRNLDDLRHVPPWNALPEDFKWGRGVARPWRTFVDRWFFQGAPNTLVPHEGVDSPQAIRAVKTVLHSMRLSHEHKMAAASFLLAEWFEVPAP